MISTMIRRSLNMIVVPELHDAWRLWFVLLGDLEMVSQGQSLTLKFILWLYTYSQKNPLKISETKADFNNFIGLYGTYRSAT